MIYDNENKTIITKRLVLRMFRESDAETVAELCNNYNIYKTHYIYPIHTPRNVLCHG